jgi:hypothetical protein
MAADHVVVLDGARVVDQGDPRELAERSAAFARLFEIDLPPLVPGAKGDRTAAISG